MADIVDDFLTRLVAHVPDLPLEKRLDIEREIRTHHGGTRAGDIAKGVGGLSKNTRTFVIGLGLRQASPLSEVFARAGVSRATGYRVLRRRA